MSTVHWYCHSRPASVTFAPAVIPAKAGIHEFKIVSVKSGGVLMASYYVYILASRKSGTLYIGVTNDLVRRVYEHKKGLVGGFTKKYKVHKLVFFEEADDVNGAIIREKQMKKWNRNWKVELIEKGNPEWKDLYPELL